MTYEQALAYIHEKNPYRKKKGLDNMFRLMELLGNPEKKLSFVHVAGTNGKGSTVALMNAVCVEAGYRTGMYTSPYFMRFNERIRLNGIPIPDGELARLTALIKEKADIMAREGDTLPTEFEMITAMAFQYYREQQCDLVLLEVGLGGRWDCTNVIPSSLLSVMTVIGLDHEKILGDTLEKIAWDKAGIIRENGFVVSYPQKKEAADVIEEVCAQQNAQLRMVGEGEIVNHSFHADSDGSGTWRQVFDYGNRKALEISLQGKHQLLNCAVAVEALNYLSQNGFPISEDTLRRGLRSAKWEGRFELVAKSPDIVIDGAHNPQGAEVLAQNIRQYYPDQKIVFIIGVLADKNYRGMVQAIAPIARTIITVTPHFHRAFPAEELAECIRELMPDGDVLIAQSVEEAICLAKERAGEESVICAFGSLHYIGDVKAAVMESR